LKSFSYGSFHSRSCDVTPRPIRLLELLALSALALLLTGCATRSSLNRLRTDVASMQIDLSSLRQAQQAAASDLGRASAENRSLEARIAEVAAALKQSTAEVARLRAQVEAVQAEQREARAKAAAPAPAQSPAPAAPPAPTPAPTVPVPPPPSFPPTPAPAERPRPPATRAQTPEQVYSAALATFRAREHGQAVLDFLDFIAKYPRHPLVANAQYWIGEAYYVQRDFRQAMLEFQKVPATAPGSAKAGDALLKIGLCQRQLRDEPHARQTWQRVVREFPKSEAAVKARTFLRTEPAATRH
jgi:tol-pal system protein YbgF